MIRISAFLLGGLLVIGEQTLAQERQPTDRLRVFLDCHFCDSDHFRREAPFVDYMRNRQDADLHVFTTRQRTGAGTEWTFTFIGLGARAGRTDTLRVATSDTDTADERRSTQFRTFLIGLLPYLQGTPAANRIRVSYAADPDARADSRIPEHDPWNFWVFEVSASGFFAKESRIEDGSVNGGVEAERVTDALKVEFGARGRLSREALDVSDDSTVVSTQRSYSVEGGAVWSLDREHWAAGGEVLMSGSTFRNRDLQVRAAAAVEYSIFPYSESTRRAVTIRYSLGANYFEYETVTIFGVTEETRLHQELEVEYEAIQPWGRVDVAGEASSFLHDLSLHRLELSGAIHLNLVRGLSLRTRGSVARIKDQIHISGADATEEEILLRRRELGTDFSLFLSVGLSYRFGSIFNNVVNPRM